MKLIFSFSFILMGCLFLLVSTVLYSSVTDLILSFQSSAGNIPSFWDLSKVLKIVRIIFIIVGSFLTVFGIIFLWIKKS